MDTTGLNHTVQLSSPGSGTICWNSTTVSRQYKVDRVGSVPFCLKDAAGGAFCSFCFLCLPPSSAVRCQLERKRHWTEGVNQLFIVYIPVRTSINLIHFLTINCKDGCQEAREERHWYHEFKALGQLPFLTVSSPSKDKAEQPPSWGALKCSLEESFSPLPVEDNYLPLKQALLWPVMLTASKHLDP